MCFRAPAAPGDTREEGYALTLTLPRGERGPIDRPPKAQCNIRGASGTARRPARRNHMSTSTLSRLRRRRSGVMLREWRDGWLFALPFILGFVLWTAGPMLYSIYLVFQDWDMLTPPQFVGLDNLVQLTVDPLVKVTLLNTAYFTFIGVPLQ